jgi:hypothetical protein
MKQLARALVLAVLSALTAEFLLGDQWLAGATPPGSQLAELVLYTAFYGSAANLIRELARRTGRGWPTILVLALAFGMIEEGIVDQSLFNPNFAGEHLLAYGFIPALGIGGPWTIFVLTLHVIWSFGAPIAVAEALFPRPLAGRPPSAPQTQASWLGTPGIVAAVVLYLVGGNAIFFATTLGAGFQANPAQLILSLCIAAVLLVVALRLPRRAPRGRRPLLPALIVSLIATSAFMVLDHYGEGLSPWLSALLAVVILAGGALVAARFRMDVLGLAIGALITYAWIGLVKAAPLGLAATIEQCVIVALVLGTALAATRTRKNETDASPTVSTADLA